MIFLRRLMGDFEEKARSGFGVAVDADDASVSVDVSYPAGSLTGYFGPTAKIKLPLTTTAHAVMRWQ